MGVEITRSFFICSGHRLQKHKDKCRNLHGHSYQYDVTLHADALEEDGMVFDFGDLDELVGNWLKENLDHAMILEKGDPFVEAVTGLGSKTFIFKLAPTAENLARLVFGVTENLLAMYETKAKVICVTCHEGPKSSATYGGVAK